MMFSSPNESLPSTLPLLRGLSPLPPFPASPDHHSIDTPLSSISQAMNDDSETTVGGVCHHPMFAITGVLELTRESLAQVLS
jgi:hypothetical protein